MMLNFIIFINQKALILNKYEKTITYLQWINFT
ncbi:hypothetical protein ELAN111203_07540 [Elizabethkingia anophelis]